MPERAEAYDVNGGNMPPQLSLIIPVYRVEQYLPECLASILNQTDGEQIEILIIDDGSPDSSGELADAFARRHSFIRVVHKRNEGVAAARNTGLHLAKGEWIYFVDSDDWLAEGAIDILLKRSEKNTDADILLFDAWKNTGHHESAWEHFPHEAVWTETKAIRKLQRGVLYFPAADPKTGVPLAAPWDKLYRRNFLLEKELCFRPELKVLDDMVFNVAAFGKARRVVYCKEKIYHYRYVPASITNSYRPDRVAQDCRVWSYLNDYMTGSFQDKCHGDTAWDGEEREEFRQAYYCRIIKSFSICCRLTFFHPRNPQKLRTRIEELEAVLRMEPYRTAFWNVEWKKTEWRLKAVVFMGRTRAGAGIYLLHRAQCILSRIQKR